ncbi:MAG: SusC/RagA family TonB-linked outer membrane protein [Saprospiraceae bacterium]|nr:SusC/RagA family TonB-linked outer membrane protein [Saprospiraceae bacterium]
MKYLIFALALISLHPSALAQLLIHGTVKSASDQSDLIGASIVVKGTSIGTVTDVDGRFEIDVTPGSTIEVSYVGFQPQSILIDNANPVNIILAESASGLTEVVVTALGIEKSKSKVGFAVQTIAGSDLIKAREPNPINSLTGKVAGLNVGASAEILGAPQILLRGSSNVLYVVDGVPIQSDTWNISPDDIESITVLKGPNASALYGSRGQFGAIQITTKRGTKDKRGFSVDFNSSTMVENGFMTIPKVQHQYGPGDHGRYAFKDGRGGGLNDGDYDIWGPKFEGQLIPQYDSPVDPVTGVRLGTPYVARGTNNLQRFLRPGLLSTNNIAISTAGENYDLRFSGTQTYQKGIVPNTKLNGTNFNLSGGLNFSKRLRFESNLNFNRQYTPNIPDVQYGPNSIIYNIIIWGGSDWDINDMRNYWQEGKEGLQQIYAEYQRYNNPYFSAYEWLRGHYKNDIYGTAGLTYEFSDHFKVTGRTQITTYDLFRTEKFPYSATSYGREQSKGDYREDNRNLFENNSDVLFTYENNLGRDFNFNLSAGGNIRNFKYASTYATTDYLNVPGWYNLNNSLNPRRVYNFDSDMMVSSAYSYLDLGYKNILNLSLTGRIDKNSTLPINNNSFFYPSASLSFVLSEAIKMPSFLPYAKLRASYANVGSGLTQTNIGPADRATGADVTGYGIDYQTPFGGPQYINSAAYSIQNRYNNQPAAFYSNSIANPNLEPSFSSSLELGSDLRFFQNRLGVDFTYFKSTDGPRIFNLPVSEATGYNSLIQNGIKTDKTGVELTLTGKPIRTKNFEWNVLANWSTYKDVLKEIYPGVEVFNQYLKIGDRTDKYYAAKVFRTQDGQIINDGSGRPLVNPTPQFMGYLNPDWIWGLSNQIRYKNLGLNFQFDGRVGGVIVNYVQRQTFRGGRNIETVEGAMGEARYQDYKGIKSWVGEGVQLTSGAIKTDALGNITNYNELQFKPNASATFLQDYISRWYATEEANLINRTYAKLREVTLSYNIPNTIFKNTFFQSATVSLIGRNLLYFSDARNNDIDMDQFAAGQGYSDLQTPTLKRYGVNLNITF